MASSNPFQGALKSLKMIIKDDWIWKEYSGDVLLSNNNKDIFFTSKEFKYAEAMSNRTLNGRNYWEMDFDRSRNKSLFYFGIATIGVSSIDRWVLTSNGETCREGKDFSGGNPFYTAKFPMKGKVGIYFDGDSAEFYKDDMSLGTAFTGLRTIEKPFHALVGALDEVKVCTVKQQIEIRNLKENCRYIILKNLKERNEIEELSLLPSILKDYLRN